MVHTKHVPNIDLGNSFSIEYGLLLLLKYDILRVLLFFLVLFDVTNKYTK